MALQVICALLLYLTLSQNSDQKSLVSTTEGPKKCGDKRDLRSWEFAVAYMMMSFFLQHFLQHRTNSLSFTLRMSSNSD
jgi:hypothetical protein